MRYAPLSWGTDRAAEIARSTEGWLEVTVPTDVRVPLIENGTIGDPVLKQNCFDSEWIEDRSWWFLRKFDAPAGYSPGVDAGRRLELVCEALDAEADIFLNGTHLGHHRSAFYPFVRDVGTLLTATGNVLLIRVTSGLEHYDAETVSPYAHTASGTYRRGDPRRLMVRKPQYVYGWDWGPRVATCGVVGEVSLQEYDSISIRGTRIETRSATAERAIVSIDVEIELLHDYRTKEVDVSVELSLGAKPVASDSARLLAQAGINHITFDIAVEKPELWWPNGWGDQPIYTALATAGANASVETSFGIRTIALDISPIEPAEPKSEGERMFAFVVNGVRIFAKGGNWIPADSIYSRVSDEKYETLVREAAEANFTMLRVWGGGIYESETFYRECDRRGILLWHDFMFACAAYPDDRPWFAAEVERELDYQTRRLRNHPCLALFCGNNENHWGFHSWWTGERRIEHTGGAVIYNRLAPEIVRRNAPSIPYWRSSPYGGDDPNGNGVGDRHHWHDCTMNPDMEKRITPEEYDKVASKFVSEYGYIGPCCRTTIERYHDGEPVERYSDLWNWHNNTFEKETVAAGIRKHYLDPDGLDLDEYLLYASLVQALMYGYSLESIRVTPKCSGSLFWMYDDCWGEVGWTIIDYYLFRKPSYYAVKRAFAPHRFILRRAGDEVIVYGVNDTLLPVSLDVEYGYLRFDGSRSLEQSRVTVGAASKGEVLRFPIVDRSGIDGVHLVRPAVSNPDASGAGFTPATLRQTEFRRLVLPTPKISVSRITTTAEGGAFTVSSDRYAHAVHFALPDGVHYSDAWFDLLPGETRRIEVRGVEGALDSATIGAVAVLPSVR